MKYSVLNRAAEIFYRITIQNFTKTAAPPKVHTEDQQKTIFDSWVGSLDPSIKDIIETVTPRQPVFKSKDGNPPRSDAPVCLVESTMAKPEANYFSKKPAFVFRFGVFPEQKYDTYESQKAYVLKLLQLYTTYSPHDMVLEEIAIGNIDAKISNSAYGGGVAVFFKEDEED